MSAAKPRILFLTAADTEILGLSAARRQLPEDFPATSARHVRHLETRDSVERYAEEMLPETRVLVVRMLGGKAYFPHGFEILSRRCRERGIALLALPGVSEPDPELAAESTVPVADLGIALEYFVHGGIENYQSLLRFLADRFLLTGYGFEPPQPTPSRGIYEPPGLESPSEDRPLVGILFYRAHFLSGNLLPIDALARELALQELRSRAVFCDSLREEEGGVPLPIREFLAEADVLVSTLAFSRSHGLDVPVIQAILCGSSADEWSTSSQGLGPRDVAMHVALPEFDGRIISVPVAFKETGEHDPVLGTEVRRNVPLPDRVRQVARLARAWCALRRIPNRERRVAILFNNYPTRNGRVGNGVGLDTPESVVRLLGAMKAAGYAIERVPGDGDALMRDLLRGATEDEEFQSEAELEESEGKLDRALYSRQFAELRDDRRAEMESQWGAPPGTYMLTRGGFAVPGLLLGDVFVGIQPSRGFGNDSRAIYHSPDLPPTHYYLAYYQWIRDVFRADAVVHMGKHGNLEWLPGKGIGLSEGCFPEIALGDLPNVYPYIINDPGEGTQAKRRAHAVVVDHLIPAMTRAESYGDLLKLEQLADEYAQVTALDPEKRPLVAARIVEVVERSSIHRDLDYERPPSESELDEFLFAFDGYLCEIKESQIRDGLHVLGELPSGERLVDLLVALVRLDQSGVRGLPAAIAEDLGIDYERLVANPAAAVTSPGCRTAGDLIEKLELRARELVRESRPIGARSAETLRFLAEEVRPRLEKTGDEITNVLRALEGRFVPPGPSGAPTRGMATILPTGRNFFSVDLRAIPTETATEVGRRVAEALLERHLRETGEYPRSIGIVVWGTSTMRTGGDDVGEILHLLGVRPVWQGASRRVVGLEVIPLEKLGRPRIDVTVRISGFFRDAFPSVVELLDEAVRRVADVEEPPEMNFLRASVLGDVSAGRDPEAACYRIFGAKPGSYGAGLLPLIDGRNWSSDRDLARVYVAWGGYAYGPSLPGVPAFEAFERRLSRVAVAVQNQDNREHDIFDSDDYFQFHGGMIASVRALTGSNPRAYFGDTSKVDRVKVRTLREECARVVRSRVVNPKWIASMMRHGYRGASELAATVDYLFGYDATARVIEPWMYESVTGAYVLDDGVRRFLEEKNPWALRGMVERLLEAGARGLWESPPPEIVARLKEIYLETEASLEETR